MMDQQQRPRIARVVRQRADPVLEPRPDVLGEDVRDDAGLAQDAAQLEQLVGDRVADGATGMKLVDGGEAARLRHQWNDKSALALR